MSNQLKAFLCSLLYQLVDYRTQPRDLRGHFHDWAKWGRISGRIDLASELGLLTHDQWVDLHRLLSSASDCLGKPFPHPSNAGPVIPRRVLHERRQAAALEAKPSVHAAESDSSVISRPSESMVDALDEAAFSDVPFSIVNERRAVNFDVVKPQAQDSANEKSEPVPAPTPRRELRLLCLLGQSPTADRSQPVATLQPMPPRPRLNGKWPSACRAPLLLRDTQARPPSREVLARCVR